MSRLSERPITGIDYAAHTPKRPIGGMGNIGDDAALAMPKAGGHKPETASETAVREKAESAERRSAAVAVAARAFDAADCRVLLEMLDLTKPAEPPPRVAAGPADTAEVRRAAEVYLLERAKGIDVWNHQTGRLDGLYQRMAGQLGGPAGEGVTKWARNLLARCRSGGWLSPGGGSGGSVPGPKLLEARGEGEPQ